MDSKAHTQPVASFTATMDIIAKATATSQKAMSAYKKATLASKKASAAQNAMLPSKKSISKKKKSLFRAQVHKALRQAVTKRALALAEIFSLKSQLKQLQSELKKQIQIEKTK